jgi:hypothetical protein
MTAAGADIGRLQGESEARMERQNAASRELFGAFARVVTAVPAR